jgi:hypothetical protein
MVSGPLPRVAGPFGSLTWLEDVVSWIRDMLRLEPGEGLEVVRHRVTAYEVVLALRTRRERLFFKGLSRDGAHEAVVTAALSLLEPDAFPPTRAAATRPDGSVWWLIEACPGETLSRKTLSEDSVARVAAACAALQQRLATPVVRGRLDLIPVVDLRQASAWAAQVLREASEPGMALPCRDAIERACDLVTTSGVPWSWVSCDLDPGNVLVDGEAVRFIDHDVARLGPAPLAIAILARRLARADSGNPCADSVREVVYRSYQEAWSPPLRLGARWNAFEIVSELVECELAWRRVTLRSERGEIDGVLDTAYAHLARRLTRILSIADSSVAPPGAGRASRPHCS